MISREKMLFFTPLTPPQLLFMGEASVKNYFSLQSEIDKRSNIKSACLIFDQSALDEDSRLRLLDSGSQLSALKGECAEM